jgi:outer membrane lipoprotein carrier protein
VLPAALWLIGAAATARIKPNPLLEALEKLSTYRAEFVQELHIPEFESIQTAAGTLFVARPDRFLLNFSSPAGDMMMADSQFVWIYSAENRQAIKQSLGLSAGFRTFLLDYDELYNLEVIDTDVDGMWKVRLIPKTGEKQVEDLILWFDNKSFLLKRLEYVDLNLNRTVYQFSKIEVNSPISSRRFTFKPPPGTEIFENL